MLFQTYITQNSFRYLSFTILTALGYAVVFLIQFYFDLFYQVSILIWLLTASVILINSRKGFLVFVFFAILGDTHYLYGFELFESIYTLKLFGLNLIDILVLLLIVKCISEILVSGKFKFKLIWWDWTFIIITMLVLIISIYGLIYVPKINNWLVDVKLFVYLILPYFLVRFWLDKSTEIFQLLGIIILTLCAKLIVFMGFYLLKFGDVGPTVIKVTLTSDTFIYCLVILLCMLVLFMPSRRRIKFVFTSIALMAGFRIIFSFGREVWVWAGLSFILFIALINANYRVKFIKIAVASVSVIIITAAFYYPSLFDYLQYNVQTFSLRTESVKGEISGAVRMIEWINVVNQLSDENAILHGMGMGATWSDKYFPLPKKRDPFSFPTEENEHVFTHMATSRFLLKMGLLGSGIFWFAIFYSWVRSIKFAMRLTDFDKYFLLALLIGSITVIAKIDLVRITLFGGLLLGLIANFIIVKINSRMIPT